MLPGSGDLPSGRRCEPGPVLLVKRVLMSEQGRLLNCTPSKLPTRSSTAMTAGLPCAAASFTACAMMVCTSAWVRNDEALAQKPLQPESGVDCGGGGEVPLELPELLPPLHAASVVAAATISQPSRAFTIPIGPSPRTRIECHAPPRACRSRPCVDDNPSARKAVRGATVPSASAAC